MKSTRKARKAAKPSVVVMFFGVVTWRAIALVALLMTGPGLPGAGMVSQACNSVTAADRA